MDEVFRAVINALPEIIASLAVALVLAAVGSVCAYWKRRNSYRQNQALLRNREVKSNAKISELRRRVLRARSSHELRSVLHEVNTLISRDPHNPQVNELRDIVEEAMHPRVYSEGGWISKFLTLTLIILIILTIFAIGAYYLLLLTVR